MKNSLLLFQRKEDNAVAVLRELVRRLKAKVTVDTVRETLHNHPEPHSLLSLGDALTEWKIDNAAIHLDDVNRLGELPLPFVAHQKAGGGMYTLVTEVREKAITRLDTEKGTVNESTDSFNKLWTDVVLVAEPTEQSGEVNYAQKRKQELLENWRLPFVLLGITGLLALSLVSWADGVRPLWLALVFSKTVGAILSILLLIPQFDSRNALVSSICKFNKQTDCNSILNSPAAKIGGWLSWAEIGVFYFVGGLLTLLLSRNNAFTFQVLATLAVLALPYTIFSIYYQARVAKQWCILCLGVQIVFVLESIITLPTLLADNTVWEWHLILPLLWGFGLPVLLWAFMKPFVFKATKAEIQNKELNRFKNNAHLFTTLLHQQQKMISTEGSVKAITLGNREATHTITMVTNPHCGPCARMHKDLEDLLVINPNVKAQLIFLACDGEDGQAYTMARHLLALSSEMTEQGADALTAWYKTEKKEYEVWAERYPVTANLSEFNEAVQQHCNWCDQNRVTATPTLYVNGYKLPDMYRLKDVRWLINSLEPVATNTVMEA